MLPDPRDGETITDRPGRQLVLLLARDDLTLTWTRHAPGQEGTDLHVHHDHPDVFHVLDGELTFPVGTDGERLTVTAGGTVHIPAGVVHAFVNASDREATWLNLHAPDSGFAAYLRSGTAWDSHDPPADGGRPASEVLVVENGVRPPGNVPRSPS